jgi:predicted ATP-grasp superfamily ATP-dependent carboligase
LYRVRRPRARGGRGGGGPIWFNRAVPKPVAGTATLTETPALVTDVHLRSVVAGVRGFGRAGIPLVAAARERSAPGLWSRYTRVRALVPDVLSDPEAFADAVLALARKHSPVVVYPGREEALDALLDRVHELPDGAVLPYPRAPVVRRFRYKPGLAELGAEAGLVSPRVLALAAAGELRGRSLPLPCVIKEVEPGGVVNQTTTVGTELELRAFLGGLPDEQPLLVQERVLGPLVGLTLLLERDGRVAARFQQRAERTWPAAAGGSSLAVSVAPDEALVEQAAKMLSAGGYWGFAQVQFIGAAEGYVLIDVNPRFYGTLPLALACGVNFCAGWHAVALGEPPPPQPDYPAGFVYRWFEGDLSAAFRGYPRRLLYPPGRARAGAAWARDDPAPSFLLSGRSVKQRVDRRLRDAAARLVRH